MAHCSSSSSLAEFSSSSKKVLILGATGVGKSYILNRLLNFAYFSAGCETRPVTTRIQKENGTIDVNNGNFNLCAFDTPGVTDPKTARATIDSIMKTLKDEPFNQLIIVVEYSRASVDFYNHLEILERCLNGLVDSSVMLIINKAPNQAQLKKAKKESVSFDLDQNLKRFRDEIARIFKFIFSADFVLVDEGTEDEVDVAANDAEINEIRNLINSSELFQFSNAKTWSELLQIFEESKKSKENEIRANNLVKSDLQDQIGKDIKNISHMESQLESIKKREKFINEVKEVAGSTVKHLLKPAVFVSKRMLKKPKEETMAQIDELKKKKVEREARLVTIKNDIAKLNEERENYLTEITRLQKLLREH